MLIWDVDSSFFYIYLELEMKLSFQMTFGLLSDPFEILTS